MKLLFPSPLPEKLLKEFWTPMEGHLIGLASRDYFFQRLLLEETRFRHPNEFNQFFFPGLTQPIYHLLEIRDRGDKKALFQELAQKEPGEVVQFFERLRSEKRAEDNDSCYFLMTRACRPFLLSYLIRFLGAAPALEFSRVKPFLQHKDPRVVANLVEAFAGVGGDTMAQPLATINSHCRILAAIARQKLQGFFPDTPLPPLEKLGPFMKISLQAVTPSGTGQPTRTGSAPLTAISDNLNLPDSFLFGYSGELKKLWGSLKPEERSYLSGIEKTRIGTDPIPGEIEIRKFWEGPGKRHDEKMASLLSVKPISPGPNPSAPPPLTFSAKKLLPKIPEWRIQFAGREWDLTGILLVVILNLTGFFILLWVSGR